MAGIKDTNKSRADYMTAFAAYRTGITGTDATVAGVTAVMDLSASVSATRNRIQVIPVRTGGAGTIDFDIYVLLDGSINTYTKVVSQAAAASGTLYTFSNLPSGPVKIIILTYGSGTWVLNTRHSDTCGHD